MTSAFEHDILGQAAALGDFDQIPYSPRLTDLLHRPYRRIIFTGMGSSHYAALPSWRRLTAAGQAAWWLDSGQLLDSPDLVTDDSLLIATSQSGASGEVVALLDLLEHTDIGCCVIGITNDTHSPLAVAADCSVALCSGPEANVSAKSYLNTLAAHNLVVSLLLDCDTDEISTNAAVVDDLVLPDPMAAAASAFVRTPAARLAFVGYQDHAATAMYAGLITKEAAKIPAQGYIGGEFRHGPIELAGPGLTAVIFGGLDADANASLVRLSRDLLDTGSTVIVIGGTTVPEAINVEVPPTPITAQLCHGAVLAQWFAVALARAKGITPGAFEFGSKITTAL